MSELSQLKIIARIRSDFPEKFGIPRQSGLVEDLKATIVFEPEFRNPDTLRGLEGFSHLWLIWQFSKAVREDWSPTVRPPRLGGNERLGVFATRSPFRPNPIGLSCVKLDRVELHPELGPVIHVAGADLLDGTPIYDIKPYLPYADCKPEALGGFASLPKEATLEVDCPEELLARFPTDRRAALLAVLVISPLFGLLSTMVVRSRMSFFSDALGHSAFTGIAIGAICGAAAPLWVAVIFSIFFALLFSFVRNRSNQAADTIIGVFSSSAVALGIFIATLDGGSFAKYNAYLIGDILSVTPAEIGMQSKPSSNARQRASAHFFIICLRTCFFPLYHTQF